MWIWTANKFAKF